MGIIKPSFKVMRKDTLDKKKVYPLGNNSTLGKEKFLVYKET